MKGKRTTQSVFLNPRALVSLLCFIAVSALVLRGTMLAFSHSETPTSVSQRTLTFVERVAYQQAIEDVYFGAIGSGPKRAPISSHHSMR
jgi:hypothetical protein